MAITKSRESHKSPSQSPTEFFKSVQSGGTHGAKNYTAPTKLSGGPQRENVMGGGKRT
jgi:hypothetical protein